MYNEYLINFADKMTIRVRIFHILKKIETTFYDYFYIIIRSQKFSKIS